MSSERLRRIQKVIILSRLSGRLVTTRVQEIVACQEGWEESRVYCEVWNDSVEQLKGLLLGPEGTPYEGMVEWFLR